MSDKIKTREIIKDIKILDKTGIATNKMKNAYIRTKDEAKQTQESENESPSEYATDNATRGAENVTYSTGYQVKKQTGNLFDKAKAAHKAKNQFDNASDPIKKQAKRTAETNIHKTMNTATQTTKQATDKIIRTAPEFEKTIKQSSKATNKAFKKTLKGTIKEVPKTIKNAERTVKATIKTSQQAVKVATKTAQISLKASKLAMQSARATAKVAVATAKVGVKAAIAAIKAIIASVKELVSLIAAGGWIAVVIILVICMVGFILSSGFGIFLSDKRPNSQGYTISQVISELNNEYLNKIEQIKTGNPHDIVVYNSTDVLLPQIKWDKVVAVYAVKTFADPNNPTEAVTIDDLKKEILRTVLWDMIEISSSVTTEERELIVVSIDKNGNEVTSTETVSKKVLTVTIYQKKYSEIVIEYGFTFIQNEQLKELLSNEYDSMWAQLLGNYCN